MGSVSALLVFSSACAALGARSAPATAPLAIPEAPPRVISPVAIEPEEQVVDAPTVVPTPPEASAAPRSPTRVAPAAPVPRASVPEPASSRPSSPPLNLAPPAAALEPDVVRTALARTTDQLRSVNRTGLSSARRTQYDTAQQFLRQATVALAAGNVTFAHYLGEKASTLVADLTLE